MTTKENNYHQYKIPVYQIMAHNNKWSPIYYQSVCRGIRVTAVIPQTALKKKTHTIPRELAILLQMPSAMSKMELSVKYGVHTTYEFIETETVEEEMA